MVPTKRLAIVVAGDSRKQIEQSVGTPVWRILADNGFVERTTVSCVGFYRDLESDSLIVVLPKAFNNLEIRDSLLNNEYKHKQLFRLIRLFSKIRRLTDLSVNDGLSNLKFGRNSLASDPVLDSLDAALQLRRDYRENGLYTSRVSRSIASHPNQPIDWSRTMRKSRMLLSESGIHFDQTFSYSRKHNLTHPLRILQAACLNEIFTLTNDRERIPTPESRGLSSLLMVRQRTNSIIRELNAIVYDARGKSLIWLIKSYLGESSLISSDQVVNEQLLCYAKDFEMIWERVLRDVIAPSARSRSLACGEWYAWPFDSREKGIQPEFDIRLEDQEGDTLIDAKDYRIINGSRWIGSSADHYKQIIYRKLLDHADGKPICNILAFPGVGQKSLFQVRGCHLWKEIEGSRVFEVTVDYEIAVSLWLREISIDIGLEIRDLLAKLAEFSDSIGER